MATLLLIDGSSYLYRAFHAIRDLSAPDGTPSNAVFGFVNMLKKLRQQTPADYIACVFDAKGKTFRDDLYEQYKAQRPPMPDELRVQIEPIHQAVAAFGIPILMVSGVEADDVIGTLAREASRQGITTIMSTGDKDMAQLVDEFARIENSMTEEVLRRDEVFAKFNVWPEQIVDYLTLVGDTVDNVPGVPKCGPKTAAKWLAEYQTLDNLVAHADDIKGVVGQNLRDSLAWLPMAKQLVTIKCDVDLSVELPNGISDLQTSSEDSATLLALFKRFGFRTWIRELESRLASAPAAPVAPVVSIGSSGDLFAESTVDVGIATQPLDKNALLDIPKPIVERHYETINTAAKLSEWLAKINAAELTAFDTETTSLDAMQAHLVGMSFSVVAGEAAYLPLAHNGPDQPEQLPLDATLALLKPWLESVTHHKVGQNLKYDQHILANYGITLAGISDDTLLMSYVLASHERHNMDDQAARELGETTIKYEEICGKGAKQIGFAEVDVEIATQYAAEDADITLRLAHTLKPRLTDKLLEVYRDIEMPSRAVLYTMERNGILLDAALLQRQSHDIGLRLIELENQAYELAGQPFNLASPKQLGEIFFEKLKLPVVKKTPKGAPSTDEEVLSELAKDYPLPKVLLEHRSLSKLKSTYTDKLPLMVNPKTGRVHTSFNQTVAVTGRLSSSDPNLQNIPVRTAEGRKIREAFIAAPGCKLVSADYSQIELRIMAHLSNDAAMLKAFELGHDIHKATAAEVFGVPLEEVTSEQRRYAKSINFGLIYGMGVFGLAAQLEITREAAKTFIERYFNRFSSVAEYMEQTRQIVREQGFVETVFGRRLWLPEIKSANAARRAGAERAAINGPMQGTAADLIKLAMVAVADWLVAEKLQSKLLLQVHDELILEVPESELELVKTKLPEIMAGVAKLNVPLLAEVGVGMNWEEAH